MLQTTQELAAANRELGRRERELTQDIAARKASEEGARRTTMLLDSIVENLPDMVLVKDATDQAKKAGVAGRVTFVAGDLFVADIGQATVVTLYLLPSMMADVEAKLRKELKPGTRIVGLLAP